MTSRNSVTLAMSLIFLSAVARGYADCSKLLKPADNIIKLDGTGRVEAVYFLENPLKGKKGVKAEFLTESELLTTGKPAANASAPSPFTLGICTGGAPAFALPGGVPPNLDDADGIIIRFVPETTGATTTYLRLVGTEPTAETEADNTDDADDSKPEQPNATYKLETIAGVPDTATDSRYKVWAYTGYTYLRSQHDFKDGFAEFLARFETRLVDERVAMEHYEPDRYAEIVRTGKRCHAGTATKKHVRSGRMVKQGDILVATDADVAARRAAVAGDTFKATAADVASGRLTRAGDIIDDICGRPSFAIARIYGEVGLTGTALVSADETNNVLGDTSQAFGGSVGAGYGWTRLVGTRDPAKDTNAFSMLFVGRLGILTIPGNSTATPATTSKSAYNYSTNLRIENDFGAGNFEGAYFEIGWGESEQFTRKKYPRLRFDGLLPINSGSKLFRFAGRLQIDAPRPFPNAKTDPKDPPDNLGNEIRISILFNMDLLELGRRMSGK